MKYDDASWHYKGNKYPKGMDERQGAVHIAFFFVWAMEAGIVANYHLEDSKELNRELSPVDIFVSCCKEELSDKNFSNIGNKFIQSYYSNDDKSFSYLMDYSTVFWQYDLIYTVEDNWGNYELVKNMLDKRFNLWKTKLSS